MRGTPLGYGPMTVMSGIIPAYAGNTTMVSKVDDAAWDHPRVCGEHAAFSAVAVQPMGSSPRMRGTLWRITVHPVRVGIIPAYAGNTGRFDGRALVFLDHPRVCGEHKLAA